MLTSDQVSTTSRRSLENLMGVDEVVNAREGYLDGVRALAVVMVLATHSWQFAGRPRFGGAEIIFETGYIWIDVFFILSAYLLTRPWFTAELRGRPWPSFRTYMSRRIHRIAPAYYVSIIAVLAAYAGTKALPTSAIEGSLGFWNLGSVLLFVQNYVPVASRNFNGLNSPWWTLGVELTWYFVLPLAAAAFMYRRWRIALPIAIVVSLVWAYVSLHSLDAVVNYLIHTVDARAELRTGVVANAEVIRNRLGAQLPAFAVDFAVGLVLARLEVVRKLSPEATGRWTSRPVAIAAFVAGVMTIVVTELVLLTWGTSADMTAYSRVPFAIGLGLCLLGMAYGPRALRRPFELTAVRYVGWVSYGVYLYHVPILAWLSQRITPTDPLRTLAVYASITLALSVVAGTVSWLIIERAFLVKHPRPKWAPKAIAAVIAAALVATYAWVVTTRPDPLLLPFEGFTTNAQLSVQMTLHDALARSLITAGEEKVLRDCGVDSAGQTAGGNHRDGWVVVGAAFDCTGRPSVAGIDEGSVRHSDGIEIWLDTKNPNPDFPVRLTMAYPSDDKIVVFTIYARTETQALSAYPQVLTASYLPS
ncbi:acyltransferase [Smaragdicoccus niigatensis]